MSILAGITPYDRVIEQRGPLQDFANDHLEPKSWRCHKSDGLGLAIFVRFFNHLKTLPKFVSRLEPTIAMSRELYMKLERQLRSVINREGKFAWLPQ